MIPQDGVKSKLKVALIRVQDQSAWISCRSIMDNLCESYSQVANTQSFYLYSQTSSYQIIEDLISAKVNVIAFVDHRVRLPELLRSSKLVNYIQENNIKVLVHTFGCFVDRLPEYYELGQILFGQDVVFLGASPRHVKLVEKVMKAPEVRLLPFPVDTGGFKFDEQKRKELRESLKIKDTTTLLIYTGRISALKNVELSIKLIAKLRQSGKDLQFLSIGNFDSFEPLTGQPYIGEMEQIHARVMKTLDPTASWYRHLNFIPHAELKHYLSAADAFISLGTFRGEDFGMSVPEATSSGLPAFLTDWGGLGGLRVLPHMSYASVSLETSDIKIDLYDLTQKLLQFNNPSIDERKEISQATDRYFGIDAIAEKIAILLKERPVSFHGLNPKWVVRRNAINSSGFGIMSELKDLYEEYCR